VILDRDPILNVWIDKFFYGESTPDAFKDQLLSVMRDKKGSLGVFHPWAWWTEVTRGCNLRCGFCATRLFPKKQYQFMTMKTWMNMLNIIKVVSPMCRLEIGNAGEPTLNKELPKFFTAARKVCPTIQLMVYTNGTTLLDGSVTYEELFESGLNFIYVDMYAPHERHIELARMSGYQWYEYGDKSPQARKTFTYQNNPGIHGILLCPNPTNWSKRKISRGAFSTFFNNLDWPAAEKYGLKPVVDPPKRPCDLPMKYPVVYYDGSYTFCCFDFMRQVAGTLGNVSDGIEGFFLYWFGKYMQSCRAQLSLKNRATHSMCGKCGFISARCDIPVWQKDVFKHYWNGKTWQNLLIRKETKP